MPHPHAGDGAGGGQPRAPRGVSRRRPQPTSAREGSARHEGRRRTAGIADSPGVVVALRRQPGPAHGDPHRQRAGPGHPDRRGPAPVADGGRGHRRRRGSIGTDDAHRYRGDRSGRRPSGAGDLEDHDVVAGQVRLEREGLLEVAHALVRRRVGHRPLDDELGLERGLAAREHPAECEDHNPDPELRGEQPPHRPERSAQATAGHEGQPPADRHEPDLEQQDPSVVREEGRVDRPDDATGEIGPRRHRQADRRGRGHPERDEERPHDRLTGPAPHDHEDEHRQRPHPAGGGEQVEAGGRNPGGGREEAAARVAEQRRPQDRCTGSGREEEPRRPGPPTSVTCRGGDQQEKPDLAHPPAHGIPAGHQVPERVGCRGELVEQQDGCGERRHRAAGRCRSVRHREVHRSASGPPDDGPREGCADAGGDPEQHQPPQSGLGTRGRGLHPALGGDGLLNTED